MARQAQEQRPDYASKEEIHHCALPQVTPRDFGPGFDPERAAAILVSDEKWVNGTPLRYHFVEAPPTAIDLDVVREAFLQWQDLPIGLSFTEVDDPNEAEIRIGFDHSDGSWSYVGRQVLDRPVTQRTMNFGWTLSGWSYGRDTALHEIGHTIGLPHEHQNPNAGIVWNEEAVLKNFAGPPNQWSPEKTEFNILRKIPSHRVQGSDWDQNSIMHYQFDEGLIEVPTEFQDTALVPDPNLSEGDVEWVQNFYPPEPDDKLIELGPFQSRLLNLAPAGQADFLVEPSVTRKYTFQTFGSADTVMVLFEEIETGPEDAQGLRMRAGNDDSGTDLNARFRLRLFKGRRYILRVRLYWAWDSGEAAVMMW